jgi:hypothetical protein
MYFANLFIKMEDEEWDTTSDYKNL